MILIRNVLVFMWSRPRFRDRRELFFRGVLRRLERLDRLAVGARLLAGPDAADDHAVAVTVHQRERVREVGADVAERVVADESDARHLAARDELERFETPRVHGTLVGGRGVLALERAEAIDGARCAAAQEPVVSVEDRAETAQARCRDEQVVPARHDDRAHQPGEHRRDEILHGNERKRQDEGQVARGTRKGPLTVAPFRAWRGSRIVVARGPTLVEAQPMIRVPKRFGKPCAVASR